MPTKYRRLSKNKNDQMKKLCDCTQATFVKDGVIICWYTAELYYNDSANENNWIALSNSLSIFNF